MKILLTWLGTTLALWLFIIGASAKKTPEMEANDWESARTDALEKGHNIGKTRQCAGKPGGKSGRER